MDSFIKFFTESVTFNPKFSTTDPVAKTEAPSVTKPGLVKEVELRVGLRVLQKTIFQRYLGVNKISGKNWSLEEIFVDLSKEWPPWFEPGTAIRRAVQYYCNQFVATGNLERQMSVFKLIDTPFTQARRDDTVKCFLHICKDAEDTLEFDCPWC